MNHLPEFIDHKLILYNDYVGGYLILLLLIPTGLYMIFRLKFLNVTMLGHTIRIVAGKYDIKSDAGMKRQKAVKKSKQNQ